MANSMHDASISTGSRPPLHIETCGQGPDVVLVHGWGLHGGVWADLVEALAPTARVSVVELPGHGFSPDGEGFDLAGLADWLGQTLPGPRIWVGWSLGALACLQLALQRPALVRGLGLLAATPRFTAGPDWPWGTEPQLLESFAAELQRDANGILMRFLGLQVQGAQRPQGTLKTLRGRWAERPAARLPGLLSGLQILRTADLRSRLGEIRCPTLVVAGERDRLVPPQAGAQLAASLADVHLETVAGAGHAPFVADPARVAGLLRDFIGRVASAGTSTP